MNTKIDEVVTASNLRSAAGSRSYSRGEDYFQRGAVHHLYCDGEQLTADVHGTHVYRARIINDDGRLDGECSCPVGRDGSFCKHLVALGLTYLDRQKNAPAEKNKSGFNWKEFLKKCDKDELIRIILEMSPNNSDVIERYRMANLPTSGNSKLRELKSKVDELFSLAEEMEEYYDDYWDSYDENDSVGEFDEQSDLLIDYYGDSITAGFGVLGNGGRGTADYFGLTDDVDIIMGTFSKSLAGIGGFMAAKEEIVDYVRHVSRPFIFCASIPPASCATVIEALHILIEQPELPKRLLDLSRYMRDNLKRNGIAIRESTTPIIPLYTHDTETTLRVGKALFDRGVYVNPVLPPAVPEKDCLLRTSYMATHTEALLDEALGIIKEVFTEYGI